MRRTLTWRVLVAMLLALSSVAQAQQAKKVPARVGYVLAGTPSTQAPYTEAFRQGLRDLGYIEGQTIVVEYRYAQDKLERLPTLAAELVSLKVDVIVSAGSTSTRSAKEATNTIPIVMAQDPDPVGNGGLFLALDDQPGTSQDWQALSPS